LIYIFHLAAKSEMIKSKLPNNVLGKIWKLADVDKDGKCGRQGGGCLLKK
jgi:hypothetical protein